jgi:Phage-related minor tail protein
VIVGTAEIDVLAIAPGFDESLKRETDPGFESFKHDAAHAGEDAGAGLRTGIRDEAGRLEDDLGEAGLASGFALRDGMKDGTTSLEHDLASAGMLGGAGLRDAARDGAGGLETDLSDLGSIAGSNLRKGVEDEAGKLGDTLEHDGEEGGGRLSKGIGSGLSKLADLASNTGLPIGGLSSKLDEAGKSMQDTEGHASNLGEKLDHLGGYALLGVGAAAAVVGAESVHLAEGMQTADTAIANAEGTSTSFAKNVGDEFLKTGASAEFTGSQMATAFGEVAGQLKATEGHVLSLGESWHFETAAATLAEAKHIEIGAATSTLSGIMQAFSLHTSEAAHTSDVLFTTSEKLHTPIESLGTQLEKVRSKLGDTSGSIGQLSGLLVDMADHGITGRAAMTGLNTGLNTLLKSSDGVATAAAQQNTAFAAMAPSLKVLAKEYESGKISSETFSEKTKALAPQQAALADNFAKASTAVQTAQLKYKEMGLTVFDAQGKFVGMGSVIDQLAPRFERMTQQQQLATATTLFGAGAAKQMTAVITAQPGAYQKATAEVEKHGAAQAAAEKQAKTLSGEEEQLSKDAINLGTKIGEVLIPIVTKMVAEFVTASTFVLAHKEILIGLAVVITGVLGTAIAVFTINKMAAFGQSFSKASGVVKQFASDVEGAVSKVIGQFTAQEAAADKASANLEENATAGSKAIATEAADIEISSGQMEFDFESVGAASKTAAGEIATQETAAATSVGTADTAIEGSNAAAGASFTALLGPLAVAAGAMYGLNKAEEAVTSHLGGIGEVIDKVANVVSGPLGMAEENLTTGKIVGEALGFTGGGGKGGMKKGPTGAEINAATSGSAASGVEEEIMQTAMKMGLSPNAAAGMVGNAAQESSLTPGDAGGGLYQMSGYPSSDSAGSAAQQTAEAIRLMGSVADQMNAAKSAEEAANIMMKDWEKPEGSQPGENSPHAIANANAPHREQAALEALEKAGGATSKGAGDRSGSDTTEKAAAKREKEEEKAKKAEEAAQKAALDKEVAAQERSLGEYVSKALAEEGRVGVAKRAAIAEEAAERKTFTATMISEEKAGRSERQARDRATAQQEVALQEKGLGELTKLQVAGQSHSLSTLNSELTKTNQAALHDLEDRLNATHKSALKDLSAELVKTWKEGEKEKAKLEAAAAQEAWSKTHAEQVAAIEREHEEQVKGIEAEHESQVKAIEAGEAATVAALDRQTTITKDQSENTAQGIADATKVALDKQAEVGLAGTAEISAHLQTVYDELTGRMDKAIGEAKVSQDEAAGKGAIAEAEAAARTSKIEGEAKVKEAEAQRQLELAKATASSSTAATGPAMVNNFYGMQNAPEVSRELGFSVATGMLPVAQPIAP